MEAKGVRGEGGPRESARERESEGERHAREQGSGGGREVGGRGVAGERGEKTPERPLGYLQGPWLESHSGLQAQIL